MILAPSLSSPLLAVLAAACFVTSSFAVNAQCEFGQGCHQQRQKAPMLRSNRNRNATPSVHILSQVIVLHETADTTSTSVLNNRIQSIQKYLENPLQHLHQMAGGIRSSQNLATVLEDLEDDLRESSNARQFYSLGGWPLLASLVSEDVVHFNNNNNNNNDDLENKVLVIRARAAGALGTAVKDVDEFRPWVLDQIPMDETTTTPLELVVEALLQVSNAAEIPGSCSESTLANQELLAQNTMYALESFLNGNYQAQVAFSKNYFAVQTLGRQAAQWAQEAAMAASTTTTNAPMSRHAIKMTTFLLRLADSIVNNVQNVPEHNDNSNQAIIQAFTTSDWCQAAMKSSTLLPASSFQRLVFSPLQETALRTLSTFGTHCSQHHHSAAVADLTQLYDQLVQTTTSAKRNNLRTQRQQKETGQLFLVKQALDALTATASQ